MTTSTTTLNPGTGGAAILTDTITTVDGAAAPASAVAQLVKIGFGAAGEFKTPTLADGLPIDSTDLGFQTDAAATTDAGTFSLIALIKRSLTNWTGLHAKIPSQGQASMAASVPVAIATNQSALPVTPPTLTKGTQGANGVSTQDLKDAGRAIKVYSATFTAATAEAMVSLTPITDGTAGTAGTTHAVTAGKRLRIQSISVSTRNAAAAIQGVVCQLRISSTGAVTTASALAGTIGCGTTAATANVSQGTTLSFPDGLELSGTQQLGISQVGTATANNSVTVVGFEY